MPIRAQPPLLCSTSPYPHGGPENAPFPQASVPHHRLPNRQVRSRGRSIALRGFGRLHHPRPFCRSFPLYGLAFRRRVRRLPAAERKVLCNNGLRATASCRCHVAAPSPREN
jgi:hypothetical protein